MSTLSPSSSGMRVLGCFGLPGFFFGLSSSSAIVTLENHQILSDFASEKCSPPIRFRFLFHSAHRNTHIRADGYRSSNRLNPTSGTASRWFLSVLGMARFYNSSDLTSRVLSGNEDRTDIPSFPFSSLLFLRRAGNSKQLPRHRPGFPMPDFA